MLSNQDFNELKWTRDAATLAVKDHGAKSDEDRITNGLKWNYNYFDHDNADLHLQIVPEIHKEEEKSNQNLLDVVPDEHSETGCKKENRCYWRNKHDKTKRRRIQICSDEESEGNTGEREVPSASKRRTRKSDHEMSAKMRTLQQLVPNCHKRNEVCVLDKAIEYMKNLQLQLQVMSIMGMNSYLPPATLDFGMHNHLMSAMALANGLYSVNQTMYTPLITASNWPLPPFTYLPFPHSPTSCPQCQCLYGLVPSFPSIRDPDDGKTSIN